jgi:hypothetical protein
MINVLDWDRFCRLILRPVGGRLAGMGQPGELETLGNHLDRQHTVGLQQVIGGWTVLHIILQRRTENIIILPVLWIRIGIILITWIRIRIK